MKKLTKLIFSCAAVAAVTAAVGTAALAADSVTGNITGSYDAGTLTLKYTSPEGDQDTILVLSEDAAEVTENMILHVDQDANFTTIKLDEAKIEDGKTYYIRIGGSDAPFLKGEFTIGGAAPSTRKLGDVDANGTLTTGDAATISSHVVGSVKLTGESLQAADVDDTGAVTTGDAATISSDIVGLTHVTEGKTVADKTKPVPEN